MSEVQLVISRFTLHFSGDTTKFNYQGYFLRT